MRVRLERERGSVLLSVIHYSFIRSWHKSEVLRHPIIRCHITLFTNTKYTIAHTRTTQINPQIQKKKNHCIINIVRCFLELNLHTSAGSVLEPPRLCYFLMGLGQFFGFVATLPSPAIAITRPQPKSPMHRAPTPQFTQVRCSNHIVVLLISTVYNYWVLFQMTHLAIEFEW